jgi:streptogramin lyase
VIETGTDCAVDGAGNMFFGDAFNGQVFRVDATAALVTAIAGKPRGIGSDFGGDGGPALAATIWPTKLALDRAGNIFFYDYYANAIRRIDATTRTLTRIAGNGMSGDAGDDGQALTASLAPVSSLAVDSLGNIYLATAEARVRRIDHNTQIISTIAGNGTPGSSGDGGLATLASIATTRIAIDDVGDVYLSEPTSFRIRRIDHATQIITTIAGNGTPGADGDGGPATAATLGGLAGFFGADALDVAVDSLRNVYIADTYNGRIRRVEAGTGIITTVAGGGSGGDRGLASMANVDAPQVISFDASDNMYFVNHTSFRRIANGIITTVAGPVDPAGTGPSAHARLADPRSIVVAPWNAPGKTLTLAAEGAGVVALYRDDLLQVVAGRYPQDQATGALARFRDRNFGAVGGVAYDPAGAIYLTESPGNRLYTVTIDNPDDATNWTIAPLTQSTSRGFADGSFDTAQLDHPTGVFLDLPAHAMYVADTGNHVIRMLDLASQTVSTIAGTPYFSGSAGDGDLATNAQLSSPLAVARCGNGDIFIADTGNNRVRRIDSNHHISTVLGDGSPSSLGEGAPSRSYAVDSPAGVVCDRIGNVFVTSRTSVRMLIAESTGNVTGEGKVRTIYPRVLPADYPSTATSCLTGIAVVDDGTVQIADACAGMLVSLGREVVH